MFIPLTPPLSRRRLCRNEKKEPSFPRKRESSHDFIQQFSRLDARLRGHDELQHSLLGERELLRLDSAVESNEFFDACVEELHL